MKGNNDLNFKERFFIFFNTKKRFPITKKEKLIFIFLISTIFFITDAYFFQLNQATMHTFIVFFFLIFLLKISPKIYAKRKSFEFDSILPFCLFSLGIDLNLGLSFEASIKNVSTKSFGECSHQFSIVYSDIMNKGYSVPEAIYKMSSRINTDISQRVSTQLISCYNSGSKKNQGEVIKRIAKEILAKQRICLKEFSGKLAMYSLIFIIISAVIPALLQIFFVMGSGFLKLNVIPIHVFFYIAIIFPTIDIFILFFIKSKTPSIGMEG